jgi:hypothetical protein
MTDRAATFTAPVEGAREGVLELRHGGNRVAIRAAEMDVLCRAAFQGPAPKASAEQGRVTIEYPRFSFAGLLRRRARRTEIELSAALPWSLAVAGGLGHSTLELAALELTNLELRGGASDLSVRLPRPRGCVSVRIEGGASRVTLVRPPGVALVLRLTGGASRLAFDDERYGAVGGETQLETADAASAHDRYEIEVTGGASKLTIAREDRFASDRAGSFGETT